MTQDAMIRLALGSILLLISCTPGPARRLEAECEPSCLNEDLVRLESDDLLIRSPGAALAFQDYLEHLDSSACGEDGGASSLTPLWRRGISPMNGVASSLGNDRIGNRSGLAVRRDGQVALQAGTALWLLDPDGTPRRAPYGGDDFGVLHEHPFVAFAGPGPLLWTNRSDSPALVDIHDIDKVRGPQTVVNWTRATGASFETLAYSSPSVLSDGTLVWTSWAGKTRALATDGGLRWEADAVEGVALVADDDVTYWAGSTPQGRDKTGALVWAPRHPAEWTPRAIPQDEGTRVGSFIPVAYRSTELGAVIALHRRSDGDIQWSISMSDGGLEGHPERVAVAPDGTLFVTTATSDLWTHELTAYAHGLQRRWSITSSALQFAPIPGQRSEGLFTVTNDCRVNVLDASGATIASHQMLGRAYRYLPKLVDGILYVMAEVPVPQKLTADRLAGLTRPDGGTIDPERDYDCVLGRAFTCPPIEEGPFFILYAFQVE